MNQKQIRAAVEAMLFACGEPIGSDKLAQAVQLPQTSVENALEELRTRYTREDSGLCQDRVGRLRAPCAGQPPRRAAGPCRHGDPDRDRLQSAGVPRFHRAGARGGLLVQRVRPAGKGPDRGSWPSGPAGPPGELPHHRHLFKSIRPVQSGGPAAGA